MCLSMNDRTVTIKMPSGLLDRVVDELVRTDRFQNQSEAIRYATRFYLDFDKIVRLGGIDAIAEALTKDM